MIFSRQKNVFYSKNKNNCDDSHSEMGENKPASDKNTNTGTNLGSE